MAKTSLSILKQKLQNYGWKLQEGQIIDDKEYDCIGWQAKKNDFQHIDLAIEMYFPLPKKEERYDLLYIMGKTRGMREKLKKINAKYKYVLVGVPPNKRISFVQLDHSDMKLVFQRHKFGKLKILNQTKLKTEYGNA